MKTSPCNAYSFNKAPRCHAKTKRNNGRPCLAPAVRNKHRCRMHGGAKGSGAQRGNQNAFKHGFSTAKAKLLRKEINLSLSEAAEFLEFFPK